MIDVAKEVIATTDPRHAAAKAALESMHAYWKIDPFHGAVQWIEDTEGRVIVFTRGEYREKIMRAIGEGHTDTRAFEILELTGGGE